MSLIRNNKDMAIIILIPLVLISLALLVMTFEAKTKVTFENRTNKDLYIFVSYYCQNRGGISSGPVAIIPAKTTTTANISFMDMGGKYTTTIGLEDRFGTIRVGRRYSKPPLNEYWSIP